MTKLLNSVLISASIICVVGGCNSNPSPPDAAVDEASSESENGAQAPATPDLDYKVVSTDDSGNRTVEVTVERSVVETRIRMVENEQGETVEEEYDVELPIKETQQIVVPAGEDVEQAVARLQ